VKVSVVIPVYNARRVIRETIDSVLNQTWKDYEIVVIDDGSTDGSAEVIGQFAGRLRYVVQNNAGVAKARNRGIVESTGEYVAFLDHDDLWHPMKLEKQVRVLEQQPTVGMVVTDVAHIDRDGHPMGIVGPGYNPSEPFARLFVRGYVPTPSASMIRRSVLEAIGGFDEAFHSAGLDDHELWTRVAAYCGIADIPEPLTYHRNLGVKPAQVALQHRSLLLSKLMARFGHDPEKRRYLVREQAMLLADQGKQSLKEGRLGEARSQLARGLLLSLSEGCSPKTAWRCVSRILRSYLHWGINVNGR
jgi:glycosyltransferase involved in cell wall biosynthesis